MTHRFLAFLLAGILAVAALDGFEVRKESANAALSPSAGGSAPVSPLHGGNPYPEGKPE